MLSQRIIFDSLIKTYDFSGYSFLFTFHLSKNNHKYLKSWLSKVDSLGVISIPYSEITSVKKSIEKITKVYSPKLEEIPQKIFDICKANPSHKIVLVEIGGYSAEISHLLKNVVLAVEDTNQGHWNFENNKDKLTFPVISMAQAYLKSFENHLIGSSVVYSTQAILRKYFDQDYILGKRVLVLSYGGIGSAVCDTLRSLKANVGVYDIDSLKQTMAYLDGFRIVDKDDALSRADIIIGCTGKQSINYNELSKIKDGSLLVSASSKQIEFPYSELKENITNKYGKELEEVKIKHNKFFIAYKGQPINFLHDSALGDVFDIQMSLLLSCVIYGLKFNKAPGVYKIPASYQRNIAEQFIKRKISVI